jgi:hypothetical protein
MKIVEGSLSGGPLVLSPRVVVSFAVIFVSLSLPINDVHMR